jgi:integrase
MPTLIPKYRLHKGSGQALVQIDGRRIYLGKHGTEESREKYRRIIGEWLANHRHTSASQPEQPIGEELSVNELLLAYWRFAERHYVKDGKPTQEVANARVALRPVRQLYGHTSARDFGPRSLKAIRDHMVEARLSRGVINHRVSRIKRVFKWAVAEELVPPAVYHGLQAVAGLRYGATHARETEPVRPVADEWVAATLPHVSPQVAAMIQLQQHTGMRPCEVVIMRPCDIDRSEEVWVYEPYDHKNRWRGHRKLVALGPKAQQVLAPFLDRDAGAYLFSPREADEWLRNHRPVHHANHRKTPVYPSELRAREKAKLARRKRRPKRPKREHYDTNSYRRAINYGFKRAERAGIAIPHWHPNQLRHSRATKVRKKYGIEAAQVSLGHARADVTEVYAEKNLELAIQIARECG